MINFLLYVSALFLAPFIAGFLSFILMFILSPITDLLKNKHKEKLLNVALFINSFCATFLTVIILNLLLNVFKLNVDWFLIVILVVFFIINGIKRIRKNTNQDRLFEIYEAIADVSGILLGFLILLIQ